MRWSFGGHETFVIREGWLHKGLALTVENPEVLAGSDAADALGVGENMAKSIRHWLLVTGLATRVGDSRGPFAATDLGELVWQHDPYFLAPGTWWAIHMQLINQPRAGAWCWFFNYFSQPRFERAVCIERLNQYLQLHRRKTPSRNTLERDISCLLRCYSTTLPTARDDPEDGNDCGLRELTLLYHLPASGVYQRASEGIRIPAELIGYNTALVFLEARGGRGTVDLAIERLAREQGGPGAALQAGPERLYEVLQTVEQTSDELAITGLGAERVLRLPQRDPNGWMAAYYVGIDKTQADAA